MRKRKLFPIVTALLLIVQAFSPLLGLMPAMAMGFNNFRDCPDGVGNWTEHIDPVNGKVEYEAPEGKVVTEVCIKGKKDRNKSNGYLKYFSSDGWYKVGNKKCVGAEGIGTDSASALRGNASSSKCAKIAYASFKLGSVQGTSPVCDPNVNLLSNAGFETPVVANPANWDIFPDGSAGMNWKVEWYGGASDFDGQTRPGAQLELHKGVNSWSSQEGSQHAELDTDWFGPNNPLNNEPASVKISQMVSTLPDYEYELSYYFSPRPDSDESDNQLNVKWQGTDVETHSASGIGASNTTWTPYTKTVVATAGTTELAFTDHGTPNSRGTFLDNVSVKCIGPVAEPSPSPSPSPTPTDVPVCQEGPAWAYSATENNQGKRKNGTDVLPERSNPDNTLGEPDNVFFSLGVEGSMVTMFEYPVLNVEGKKDISVHEITNGRDTYPEEKAKVEASLDGANWYELGIASSKSNTTGDPSGQGGVGVALFDLETVGLPAANYLRITDMTDYSLHAADADGYDVDAIDATYGLCEEREFPRFSTVTMCKVDEQQNPLEGWNLQLLGEKVESVEVLPDDVIGGSITPEESSTLPKGDYALLASGTYKYRGGTDLQTDPGYSERLEADGYTGPYFPWINVMDLSIPGALGVTVNGNPTDWGYFSPSHEYARGYNDYEGKFSFTSLDNNVADNTGSMNVDIYKGYSGLTGENGCVTFEDVPYGEYTTNETLKQGWENVDGKDVSVEVNDATETFTLVNRENLRPAKLLAEKVVCTDEEYLPNNAFGGNITATTAQEWVAQSEGKCELAQDWDFQWAPEGSGDFGSFQTDTTSKGEPWTTFNVGSETTIPVENLGQRIEVREVFPDDSFVPFSNDGDVSAELWCTGDGANYDNWEWINNVQGDASYYCVGFNALKTGTISGHKFEDVDGDGVWDTEEGDDENGLEDWTITLQKDGEESVIAATTDENGYYEFKGLTLGTYMVCEEQQDGWMQTMPGTEGEDEDGCYEIVLETYGQVEEDKDFGNFKLGVVSGYKWDDDNGDGEKTWGEPKMSGWTIELKDDDEGTPGELLSDKVTDENGEYMFSDLKPGTYYLMEVKNDEQEEEGWVQTYPVEPTEPFAPTYHSFVISTSGQVETDMNFGNNLTADVVVTKTTETEETTPNSLVTYTIEVTNDGTEDIGVEGVTVWDDIPEGVNYHSSSPTGTYNSTLRRVTWTIPSLAVGEVWTAEITVFVPVDFDGEIAEITNSVQAWRSCNLPLVTTFSPTEVIEEPVIEFCEDDPTPENNSASAVVSVASVLGDSDEKKPTETTEETTGGIKGLATVMGNVLGASDALSATGRNLMLPIIVGSALLTIVLILNKSKLRKRA